jgi:myo-inositol-1(or 4)-monophosphatase
MTGTTPGDRDPRAESDEPLAERFAFGSELIIEAARLAQRHFLSQESLTVRRKGTQDVVSEADEQVEQLIREAVAQAFPEDAFFGEEFGHNDVRDARDIWIVDPIDGTQPFLKELSSWCVSVGFARDGVLEMGFVAAPARGEIFSGRRGHGATLNGRPIEVSSSTRLDDGLLSIGMSPRIGADEIVPMVDHLLRQGVVYYREGSGALSLAYVAAGRLIGYIEAHLNSWDGAAGVAIVEAAGGKVSPFLTEDSLLHGAPIIATNEALYPALEASFPEHVRARIPKAGRPSA